MSRQVPPSRSAFEDDEIGDIAGAQLQNYQDPGYAGSAHNDLRFSTPLTSHSPFRDLGVSALSIAIYYMDNTNDNSATSAEATIRGEMR